MIISTHDIAFYLLEQGLISAESIVDGDFMVVDVSRRNRNFEIIRRRQPGYFVKQIQKWEQRDIEALQREAACYWLAKNDSNFAQLGPCMPQYYGFDTSQHILIIELLSNGENLSDYHRRLAKFPPEVGAQLGRILGAYHQIGKVESPGNPQSSVFPQQIPWILSIHKHNNSLFESLSGANSQVLNIVQQYPEFKQILDKLYAGWKTNTLIHGDMKWENCIIQQTDAGSSPLSIKVVDWELADWGDVGWDIGAIFQSYLTFWIMSMKITNELPPVSYLEVAQYPVEEMQPAIQEFWKSYLIVSQLNDREAGELIKRSTMYSAARMIQTVYEYMYHSSQITANAVSLLQVSLNILTNPVDAIHHLLAIEEL